MGGKMTVGGQVTASQRNVPGLTLTHLMPILFYVFKMNMSTWCLFYFRCLNWTPSMGCAFFISIQFTLTFLHVVAIFYVQRKLNFYNTIDSPSVVTVILPVLTYSLSVVIGWSSVALSQCFYLKSICCNSGKTCLINSNRSPTCCNICLNLFDFSNRCIICCNRYIICCNIWI